uniref:Uncharacterized protein n=1 Tax=Opuntia streptacantha TaxID=393608 RepID=A0A7C9D3Q1_OPUST
MIIPVQRHVGHMTLPVPKQFEHLCVVGARKGRSKSPDIEIGSVFKQTPLAEHRAQAKYPDPWQYLHLFFSCCSTLLTSISIKAEITPTAPPEKDATMGST